jgi:hypothetical protein
MLTTFARILAVLITLFGGFFSRAADVRLGSNGSLEIRGLATTQRLAIDISSNLISWTEITDNAVPLDGSILIGNPNGASDQQRFFRLADADQTFTVNGFVEGAPGFGPVAGARVESEDANYFAITDRDGLFHFDHRFAKSELPLYLKLNAPGFDAPLHTNTASDAGSFVAFKASMFELPQFTYFAGARYHFDVKSGPRAGMRYTMTLGWDRFKVEGDLQGTGDFNSPLTGPARGVFAFDDPLAQLSEVLFWAGPGFGFTNFFFAGIPSVTGGTLPGNGEMTLEYLPDVAVPTTVGSVHLTFQKGLQAPRDYVVTLSGGFPGLFTVTQGSSPFLDQQGTYEYLPGPSSARLLLSYGPNGDTDNLNLIFTNQTSGTFFGAQHFGLSPAAPAEGTFSLNTNVTIVAPASLANHAYTFQDLKIAFGPDTFLVSSPTGTVTSGNYKVQSLGNFLYVSFLLPRPDGGGIYTAGGISLDFRTASNGQVDYLFCPGGDCSGDAIIADFNETPVN